MSQVSIKVFFSGAVEKFFGQMAQPPLEKIGPYAYDTAVSAVLFNVLSLLA